MGLTRQSIISSDCITAFWLVIEAKFYTGCTFSHNLIFARLVEHMESMENGEPIVKPNIKPNIRAKLCKIKKLNQEINANVMFNYVAIFLHTRIHKANINY